MAELAAGCRVTAPNPKRSDEVMAGTIIDVMSVMYFIRFDNGTEDFVFKVREVNEIKE